MRTLRCTRSLEFTSLREVALWSNSTSTKEKAVDKLKTRPLMLVRCQTPLHGLAVGKSDSGKSRVKPFGVSRCKYLPSVCVFFCGAQSAVDTSVGAVVQLVYNWSVQWSTVLPSRQNVVFITFFWGLYVYKRL